MVKILKRAPPTTTTSSSLVCIKGRGRIEGGGMDGGMVGWNDCGWKMINQSCSAVLDSLARQLSFHSLGQAGSTGLLLTQLAVIFSPPLLPRPSLPPSGHRPPPVPLLFVCRRRLFLPFKGTVLSQFTYLLQPFIESTFNRFRSRLPGRSWDSPSLNGAIQIMYV